MNNSPDEKYNSILSFVTGKKKPKMSNSESGINYIKI